MAGCSSLPDSQPTRLSNESFPAIQLVGSEPSATLRTQCHTFAEQGALTSCNHSPIQTEYVKQALIDSLVFEAVTSDYGLAEYNMVISSVELVKETAADISKAAIAGASLLLIPTTYQTQVAVEVDVYWDKLPLTTYQFTLPYQKTVSLYQDRAESSQQFADTLVEKLVNKAEADGIFKPSYIHAKLKTSDYQESLTVPDYLGEYQLLGQQLFRHPMLGTQVRYQNPAYDEDILDLFIYPINQLDWQNSDQVITEELMTVQHELVNLKSQGYIRDYQFKPMQPIEITLAGELYQGKFFEGVLSYKEKEDEPSSTFVFVMEDKFVKIRTSTPAYFAMPYIKQLVTDLQVPQVSEFMQSYRQQQMEAANRALEQQKRSVL